jgi:lipoate synthase
VQSGNYVVSQSPLCSACRNSGDCTGNCSAPYSLWGQLYTISCPFCKVNVGASKDDAGEKICKVWIGKHLARYHQGDMTAVARERKLLDQIEEEICSAFVMKAI